MRLYDKRECLGFKLMRYYYRYYNCLQLDSASGSLRYLYYLFSISQAGKRERAFAAIAQYGFIRCVTFIPILRMTDESTAGYYVVAP